MEKAGKLIDSMFCYTIKKKVYDISLKNNNLGLVLVFGDWLLCHLIEDNDNPLLILVEMIAMKELMSWYQKYWR